MNITVWPKCPYIPDPYQATKNQLRQTAEHWVSQIEAWGAFLWQVGTEQLPDAAAVEGWKTQAQVWGEKGAQAARNGLGWTINKTNEIEIGKITKDWWNKLPDVAFIRKCVGSVVSFQEREKYQEALSAREAFLRLANRANLDGRSEEPAEALHRMQKEVQLFLEEHQSRNRKQGAICEDAVKNIALVLKRWNALKDQFINIDESWCQDLTAELREFQDLRIKSLTLYDSLGSCGMAMAVEKYRVKAEAEKCIPEHFEVASLKEVNEIKKALNKGNYWKLKELIVSSPELYPSCTELVDQEKRFSESYQNGKAWYETTFETLKTKIRKEGVCSSFDQKPILAVIQSLQEQAPKVIASIHACTQELSSISV